MSTVPRMVIFTFPSTQHRRPRRRSDLRRSAVMVRAAPPPAVCSWPSSAAELAVATSRCAVLTAANGPFAACHTAVPVTPFYDACVADVCREDGAVLCTSALLAYESACSAAAVALPPLVDRCGVCLGDGAVCANDTACTYFAQHTFMTLGNVPLDFPGPCDMVFAKDTIS